MTALGEAFLGTWTYDKNEGFDAYLEAKGVPWLIRKIILLSGHVITFSKGEGDKYKADHQMTKKSVHYEFELGKEFEGVGFDNAQHKVLITMEEGVLTEIHHRLDKPDDKPEEYRYTVEGGRLVQKMKSGGASCVRFYKKK